jgi:hypothetical protein
MDRRGIGAWLGWKNRRTFKIFRFGDAFFVDDHLRIWRRKSTQQITIQVVTPNNDLL